MSEHMKAFVFELDVASCCLLKDCNLFFYFCGGYAFFFSLLFIFFMILYMFLALAFNLRLITDLT